MVDEPLTRVPKAGQFGMSRLFNGDRHRHLGRWSACWTDGRRRSPWPAPASREQPGRRPARQHEPQCREHREQAGSDRLVRCARRPRSCRIAPARRPDPFSDDEWTVNAEPGYSLTRRSHTRDRCARSRGGVSTLRADRILPPAAPTRRAGPWCHPFVRYPGHRRSPAKPMLQIRSSVAVTQWWTCVYRLSRS